QWGVAGTRCGPNTTTRNTTALQQTCADSVAARLTQHYGTTVSAYTPFSKDVATKLFETGKASTVGMQVSGGTPLVTYFGSVRSYTEDGPFTAKNFDWNDVRVTTGNHKLGTFSKDINDKYSGTLSIGLTPAKAFKVQSTALYTQTHQEVPENNNSI